MHRIAIGLLVLCLHCGSTQPPPAVEEPAPAAPAEPAATTEATPADAPSAEPTATATAAATAAAPAASAAPTSKPCTELTKVTCQITKGCAWNDLKKCVAEGP